MADTQSTPPTTPPHQGPPTGNNPPLEEKRPSEEPLNSDSTDQGQSTQDKPPTTEEIAGIDSNNLMAALSYLGLLVLIPLLVARKDEFVLFHAKQGLVILIGYVITLVAVGWIPILGNLAWLLLIIASIAGFIQALQGKRWKVPIVGDLATKFKI